MGAAIMVVGIFNSLSFLRTANLADGADARGSKMRFKFKDTVVI